MGKPMCKLCGTSGEAEVSYLIHIPFLDRRILILNRIDGKGQSLPITFLFSVNLGSHF